MEGLLKGVVLNDGRHVLIEQTKGHTEVKAVLDKKIAAKEPGTVVFLEKSGDKYFLKSPHPTDSHS